MKYPTKEEIEKANHLQICRWYRFLPISETTEENELTNYIINKFYEGGGMTPEISKEIGW